MRTVQTAIIGAGFGGIGAAIRLREAGFGDFAIFERAERLGGTWAANTYPGCACDVPSHLYSYSFALNPEWSRFFAPQEEILAYLERVAGDRGIAERIVYDAEVTSARWDGPARRWRLETKAGPCEAQVLIAAAGPLSEPAYPEIAGLHTFAGTLFHSAQWDHAHDLAGERVAVIGTGASAAQFIPHVRERAAHVDVYQRTPGWIFPRNDRAIPLLERRLLRRVPVVQRAIRHVIYYFAELLVLGLVHRRRLLGVLEWIARRKLAKEVPDPDLRARLTPRYRIGCKRIIFSDDYLPALAAPDVDLITDRIAQVTPTGVVTEDGTERTYDTIILGTGFRAWDYPLAQHLVGSDGASLADAWAQGGPQAYLGTVIHGFPNLFFLIGPNTGLGNNSMINIIEGQLVFVLDALRAMQASGVEAIDVDRAVQDDYNAELQDRLAGTVWLDGGCKSWYLQPDGTNRTLWPSFSDAFKRRLRGFDFADFAVTASTSPSAPPSPSR